MIDTAEEPGEPGGARPPTGPDLADRRPSAVTAAGAVMIVMGASGLLSAALLLAVGIRATDRFRVLAQARTTAPARDRDAIAAVILAPTVAATVVGVVVALLLVGLAIGNLRGRSGARIATWVTGGLGMLCGGLGLAGILVQASASVRTYGVDGTRATALASSLVDAFPSWWAPLAGMLSGAQTLGYIAVVVLLTVPAAHRFFQGPVTRRESMPPPMPPPSM